MDLQFNKQQRHSSFFFSARFPISIVADMPSVSAGRKKPRTTTDFRNRFVTAISFPWAEVLRLRVETPEMAVIIARSLTRA
jgi:hypothetical protein